MSTTPAQLTRISNEPQCWSTLPTASLTSASEETSHFTRSSEAFSAAAAAEMSKQATLAPCSRNSVTIARPIPALPPVTIATYGSRQHSRAAVRPIKIQCIASTNGRNRKDNGVHQGGYHYVPNFSGILSVSMRYGLLRSGVGRSLLHLSRRSDKRKGRPTVLTFCIWRQIELTK